MPIGPGKYDELCSIVMEQTNAEAVVVIVIGGDRGQGFSAQFRDPRVAAALPALLEGVAQDMRETVADES